MTKEKRGDAIVKDTRKIIPLWILFLILSFFGSLCGTVDPANARGLMMGVMGKVSVSGEAACSGYSDPDADISRGSWTDLGGGTSNIYAGIDDGTRQPTAPSTAEGITSQGPRNHTGEFSLANLTSCATSAVTVWLYQVNDGGTDRIYVSISNDGSTWTSEVELDPPASNAWQSAAFTGLSWTGGTTDFRVKFRIPDVAPQGYHFIYSAYAAINP